MMGSKTEHIGTPGWRRTGIFNIISTLSCGVLLLVWFVRVIAKHGYGIYSTAKIFEGDCRKTNTISILFHIFLLVISSLILASFRFFMQILSSPSRTEINRAHSKLRSLDIGVPSIKNLRYVSRTKTVGWILLLISSTPIHLFFNSSVFKTVFQGSDWRLTIASSSFGSQDVAFFPPGASLANAGVPRAGWGKSNSNSICADLKGFGEYVALEEYWDKSSPVYQHISKTANESKNWVNITADDCLAEYASCKPRSKYRDVIVIVDAGTSGSNGWTRSQVFSDPYNELGPIWNQHVPRDSLNSLWYSTQCSTSFGASPFFIDWKTGICLNTCGWVLGLGKAYLPTNLSTPISESIWTTIYYPESKCNVANQTRLGYSDKFNTLNVQYCLAEPSPDYTCRVGLSNILLLAAIVCVFAKALICTLIIYILPSSSIVTVGDALQSFISDPDSATLGLGTFNIADSLRLQSDTHQRFESDGTVGLSNKIQPRLWRSATHNFISALPKYAWSFTFAPIVLCMGVGIYYALNNLDILRRLTLHNTIGVSGLPFFTESFTGVHGGLGYLSQLLVANIPQFILSYCFSSYNSLFTRLVAEKEFNSYSLAPHKPLRVSYPTGEQVSTYWLQLPYKYSVPLLIASTLLHWLASNSTFLFASRGGYIFDAYHNYPVGNQGALEDAISIFGFSPLAILGLVITSTIVASIPILYGLLRLPGHMVVGACDSLVLSAACHPFILSRAPEIGRSEMHNNASDEELGHTLDREPLRELSEKKLRWGVTSLSPELAAMVDGERGIMHLSFSSEEEYLFEPVDGDLYV